MKVLKYILVIVIAVVVLVLVVAAFAPNKYAVVREVTILQPKSEVFDYIKYLQNQDNYSVWAKKDPEMRKMQKGVDGTVGYISAWESDNKEVGKGEQEIVNIVEGERMDVVLRFKEPFEATDDAYFITESLNDYTTLVKWGFKGQMDYPMNLMLLFMDMETMLGNDLQQGLDNLKDLLER